MVLYRSENNLNPLDFVSICLIRVILSLIRFICMIRLGNWISFTQDCSDYDCFDWRFRLDKIRISLICSPISDDLVRLIVQSVVTISDDKYDSLIQFALFDSRFVRFSDYNSFNLIVAFNSFLYLILGWFDSLIVFSNRIVSSNGG